MAPRKGGEDTEGVGDQGGNTSIVRDRTISRNTAPVLATPMRTQEIAFIEASGSLTRRMTRSMTKIQPNPTINSTPGGETRLQSVLRSASKIGTQVRSSNLEESRSITYNRGNRDEEAFDDDDEDEEANTIVARRPVAKPRLTKGIHSKGIQGHAPKRHSTRKKAGKATTRDSTPSDTITSAAGDGYRLRKRRKLDVTPSKLPLRRSARLAKPLTAFHKYPCLPIELQMMIWEAAITPRLVYLRNMFTLPPTPFPSVQNKTPPWFMTCKLSLKVALYHYRNMFPFNNRSRPVTRQPVNPEVDIVLFEPCCNGCRAKNCAGRQFGEEDLSFIRRLAVQIDSPFLMPTVQPCWVSITDTWPKVDTIYLMRTAIRGEDRREKVMIRIEEGQHENLLRKRFDEWKKGDGKDKPIQRIEFVTVVEKESDDTPPKDRYRSVLDRKTNCPEDIIIG